MLFSAIPGASRHHFGTDLDVYDKSAVSNDYQLQLSPDEYNKGGPFHKLASWLEQNAKEYGFFLPYKQYNQGVAREPWHISHISRSAYYAKIHNESLLASFLNESDVLGWQSLTTQLQSIYPQYVSNITPADSD